MTRIMITLMIISFSVVNLSSQDDYYFSYTDQGTIFLSAGTNFGLTIVRDSVSETTSFDLSSSLGYFFVNNVCVGITGNVLYIDSDGGNTTIWEAGPFARAYIGKSFLGAGLIITHDPGEDEQFAIQAEAGYPVFFTDHISFEPRVTYLYNLEESGTSRFKLNFSFGFYFAGRPDY